MLSELAALELPDLDQVRISDAAMPAQQSGSGKPRWLLRFLHDSLEAIRSQTVENGLLSKANPH